MKVLAVKQPLSDFYLNTEKLSNVAYLGLMLNTITLEELLGFLEINKSTLVSRLNRDVDRGRLNKVDGKMEFTISALGMEIYHHFFDLPTLKLKPIKTLTNIKRMVANTECRIVEYQDDKLSPQTMILLKNLRGE